MKRDFFSQRPGESNAAQRKTPAAGASTAISGHHPTSWNSLQPILGLTQHPIQLTDIGLATRRSTLHQQVRLCRANRQSCQPGHPVETSYALKTSLANPRCRVEDQGLLKLPGQCGMARAKSVRRPATIAMQSAIPALTPRSTTRRAGIETMSIRRWASIVRQTFGPKASAGRSILALSPIPD